MDTEGSSGFSSVMNFYESGVGKELNRMLVRPEGEPVAGVMIVHGLGEHIERYVPIAEMLAKGGCVVTGVDFPGHGRSPGVRGHVGTWETVETILDESKARLREEVGEEVALGIAAHSMGSLLSLRYLERCPEDFAFAWMGSPLLRPSEMVSGLVRLGGRVLAKIKPSCTLDSGVRPRMCRVVREDEVPNPFLHSRVSAGWAVEMWEIEKGLHSEVERLSSDLKLLVTHGEADAICPIEHARALYERAEVGDKEWKQYAGELHEPLFGQQAELVLSEVKGWFESRGIAVG
jgi:lysophospholipase